jgi:hypothetical protein
MMVAFNSTHVQGAHVPLKEPSTASKGDMEAAGGERRDEIGRAITAGTDLSPGLLFGALPGEKEPPLSVAV